MSTINFKKNTISDSLKKLRAYKDITLRELANNINSKYDKINSYEFGNKFPTNLTLIQFSNFFGVSVDFILLSNQCNFIKNIDFVKLAEKIDKLNTDQRYKVESTMETFLTTSDKSNFDLITIDLADNVHENIKNLRSNKGLSQKKLGEEIKITSSSIAHYEIKKNPSAENLIKISGYFNISIHALLTGNNLFFDFLNKAFENTVLKADKQLSLEDQKFIIKLMTKIIEPAV